LDKKLSVIISEFRKNKPIEYKQEVKSQSRNDIKTRDLEKAKEIKTVDNH